VQLLNTTLYGGGDIIVDLFNKFSTGCPHFFQNCILTTDVHYFDPENLA